MMILTTDLSNTHISIGAVRDGQVLFSCQISTDKAKTADEYAVLIQLILERKGIDWDAVGGSILSSVVPELTMTITRALAAITGQEPMLIGPGVKTGLNIRLDDPSQLGSDFVAAAVAAQAECPLPVVTVSMDTAMGIGVTDAAGAYIGGIIAPGIMVSSAALTKRASLLHKVIPQAPRHVICKNTDESMRSGIIYGSAFMLDGLLQGIDEELGQPANVIATGIWADIVVSNCRRKGIRVDPDLLHRGMWLIWQRNRKKG